MVESRTERIATRVVSVGVFAGIWALAFPESRALVIARECLGAAGQVGASALCLAWFTMMHAPSFVQAVGLLIIVCVAVRWFRRNHID